MPPPVPDREALIAAHLAYAAAYLPRARDYAASLNLAWPERFEEVTWTRLNMSLQIERPYDPGS